MVDGEAFMADRPGFYVVTVTMGTATADLTLVAFPAEALTSSRLAMVARGADRGTIRPVRERRLILRSLARDSTASPPDVVEGLTAARPLPTVPLEPFGA